MIDLKTLRLITQNGLQAFAQGRVLNGIAALHTLLPYCAEETILRAEAESLEKNYHYMLSFLRQGGDDEKRSEVQAKIQREGIALLEQAHRAIRLGIGSDLYSKVQDTKKQKKIARGGNVVDTWNSLLTPEETSEVQDDLFDLIWTAPLWSAADTAFWYDFLLRQRDMVQQHLMGAVFLALWEHYDAEKMQLLGLLSESDCHRTHITAVVYLLLLRLRWEEIASLMPPLPDSLLSRKGRALIGQVAHEMLLMLISEKDMEKELKEAEGLTKKVFEGKGKALGAIKDILALRERYLRNRLQRGLDINLSKIPLLHTSEYMKRVSHWFLPFDKTHPLFQSVLIDEKGNEKQNLSILVDHILDCDVDKLATLYLVSKDKDFSKAVQQLDDQQIPNIENAVTPEYTIRHIVQDLYRFFAHSPLHTQLANPFRERETLLDLPEFAALLSADDCISCLTLILELATYTPERSKDQLKQVVAILDDLMQREGASAPALMLKARAIKEVVNSEERRVKNNSNQRANGSNLDSSFLTLNSSLNLAISCARSAEILQPDDVNILSFLADCYEALHRPEEKLEYLQRLAELLPEDKGIRLLIPITMNEAGRHEEALSLLFKLDYELGEDDKDYGTVTTLIADTALRLGKLDVAERYTEKEIDKFTISQSNNQAGEANRPIVKLSNCQMRLGHIRLLQGDWKGALDHYEQFINAYCQETKKGAEVALSQLRADWRFHRIGEPGKQEPVQSSNHQIVQLSNCPIVQSSDLLLLHDILQAQAEK